MWGFENKIQILLIPLFGFNNKINQIEFEFENDFDFENDFEFEFEIDIEFDIEFDIENKKEKRCHMNNSFVIYTIRKYVL